MRRPLCTMPIWQTRAEQAVPGRVAANAYNLVGSYSKVTLNELYISATTDDVLGYWASKKMDFRPRRARVYGYSAAVGWSYHNANDTIIPYATLSSSNSTERNGCSGR